MPISKKRAAEIDAIADEDIDTTDVPEAGEEFFRKAKLVLPFGSASSTGIGQAIGRPVHRSISVPSVSMSYAHNGTSTKANALGMRPMQERAYEKRGEQ